MDLDWFKIKVIYPVTRGLKESQEEEELSETQVIQLRNEGAFLDGYETSIGFYDIGNDSITQINPKCFVPKDKTNKRYCSEIVFTSGTIIYASDKPDEIYKQLTEFLFRNHTP